MDNIITKIKEFYKAYGYDLFVILVIGCVAAISYNLGRNDALEKTPLLVEQDAAILEALQGNLEPQGANKTLIFRAGVTAASSSFKVAPRDPRVLTSKSSSSKKYHYSWCGSGKQIKTENQVWFPTAQAAEQAGYTLAGNCQ